MALESDARSCCGGDHPFDSRRVRELFIRYTGPGFERVQHLLEQATEAYLLGLFEASAVVARAALEVLLLERWDAKYKEPAPGGETGERLKLLVAAAAQRGVITEPQKSLAVSVKQAGDSAAHGGGG